MQCLQRWDEVTFPASSARHVPYAVRSPPPSSLPPLEYVDFIPPRPGSGGSEQGSPFEAIAVEIDASGTDDDLTPLSSVPSPRRAPPSADSDDGWEIAHPSQVGRDDCMEVDDDEGEDWEERQEEKEEEEEEEEEEEDKEGRTDRPRDYDATGDRDM